MMKFIAATEPEAEYSATLQHRPVSTLPKLKNRSLVQTTYEIRQNRT
jgi:hypothetical protein